MSNTTPDEYLGMVRRAKEYIAAGDIFQVVLSQRFEAPFALPPFALYRALRRVNPSPFLLLPRFRRLRGRRLEPGNPGAGARRHGDHPPDRRHPAARRNAARGQGARRRTARRSQGARRAPDAARPRPQRRRPRRRRSAPCEVTDQFFIERYSHVMHIVSNVEGRLDAAHDALDALAAGFPAGTVSGAPKVRAMQIIDELEKEKRGLYAGCVGYFSAAGDMDTCIVLRTAIVKDGKMYVQAGAGIVADSDPDVRAAGMRQQGQGPVPRRRGGAALRQRRQARAVSATRRTAFDPLRPSDDRSAAPDA